MRDNTRRTGYAIHYCQASACGKGTDPEKVVAHSGGNVRRYERGVDRWVPDDESWSRIELQKHVSDLDDDLHDMLALLVEDFAQATRPSALKWLAERLDSWEAGGRGLFTVSTAWEFEQTVSPMLTAFQQLDFPPYAELLLQPGQPVAFRHPEYMLARDLEFLYEIYLDTESLLTRVPDWSRAPRWAGAASENAQTLARTVVLSCFNLIESFTSGLARSHVMRHPNLDDQTVRKLMNTYEPLKKRVLAVPRAISTAVLSLDVNKPPFLELFGGIKDHRDAFVHCEPGPMQSERGYVKQALFHDVSPELARTAIKSTTSAIQLIWNAVHGRTGPNWLHDLDKTGHFERVNLTVVPREDVVN